MCVPAHSLVTGLRRRQPAHLALSATPQPYLTSTQIMPLGPRSAAATVPHGIDARRVVLPIPRGSYAATRTEHRSGQPKRASMRIYLAPRPVQIRLRVTPLTGFRLGTSALGLRPSSDGMRLPSPSTSQHALGAAGRRSRHRGSVNARRSA